MPQYITLQNAAKEQYKRVPMDLNGSHSRMLRYIMNRLVVLIRCTITSGIHCITRYLCDTRYLFRTAKSNCQTSTNFHRRRTVHHLMTHFCRWHFCRHRWTVTNFHQTVDIREKVGQKEGGARWTIYEIYKLTANSNTILTILIF